MKSLDRASLLGFLLAVVGIVLLFRKNALFGHGPVSIALQGLAVVLLLWARLTFGWRSFHYRANPTPGGVITTGPYRYMRHPIYAAILYFSSVGVASNWSFWNLILWLSVLLGLGIRMACEERLLVAQCPAYAEYALRTRRVIPFLA